MNRREALKAVLGIAAVAATGGLALAVKPRAELYGRHLCFQNFYAGGADEHYAKYLQPEEIIHGPDLVTHNPLFDGKIGRYEGFSFMDYGAEPLARLS